MFTPSREHSFVIHIINYTADGKWLEKFSVLRHRADNIFSSHQFESCPCGYKTFFMLNSAEHGILNAHKYKSTKEFRHCHAQISLKCYFSLINVKMPTIIGILTFMSRKIFMLIRVEHKKTAHVLTQSFLLLEDLSSGKYIRIIKII